MPHSVPEKYLAAAHGIISDGTITAHRVDVANRSIEPATVEFRDGKITAIKPAAASNCSGFLIPGFVDSHIHIESSMLLPSQFARAAVRHGTVATVSDPHEIANVCGLAGVELMLRDGAKTTFKFYFGAPACVPATPFETSGATLDSAAVAKLLDDSRIGYLSEMMNFPGVLTREAEVIAKINAARLRGKPIDGHAPGLRGKVAARYIAAGISTDHECTTREEALDKLAAGCKIAIREGSAARNFDALQSLIDEFPDQVMFCSDDKHPDELLVGHLDRLAARAVAGGADPMNALRACSLNAIKHYGLEVGLLGVGDPADFVLVDNLRDFNVQATYINGQLVAEKNQCLLPIVETETINQFTASPIVVGDLAVPAKTKRIRIMEAMDGQLITLSTIGPAKIVDGHAVSDPVNDVLKLVVVRRYPEKVTLPRSANPSDLRPDQPAIAFVRGFGITQGAIASSVAHDSHNIIAVGASDTDLVAAINAVIQCRGGLALSHQQKIRKLPLPVAGLMSTGSCEEVAAVYSGLDRGIKDLGCGLRAPFMTLSFLALLVIPSLKLSDCGLFDVDRFEFVDLFA